VETTAPEFEENQEVKLLRRDRQSVLEQIVELLFPGLFGVGMDGQPTGRLDDIARLIIIAVVWFFLVTNRGVNTLAALILPHRVEMSAAAAATQVGHAIGTLVVAKNFTGYPCWTTAIPAEKSFGGHNRPPLRSASVLAALNILISAPGASYKVYN
jgi:hypothetical protein